MALVACVAFMLVKHQKILAEQRKRTKKVAPGAVALPGGHMEHGESVEDALRRELYEELGLVAQDMASVCTLLHRSQACRKMHYFAMESWRGDMQNHAAEALLWIPITT